MNRLQASAAAVSRHVFPDSPDPLAAKAIISEFRIMLATTQARLTAAIADNDAPTHRADASEVLSAGTRGQGPAR